MTQRTLPSLRPSRKNGRLAPPSVEALFPIFWRRGLRVRRRLLGPFALVCAVCVALSACSSTDRGADPLPSPVPSQAAEASLYGQAEASYLQDVRERLEELEEVTQEFAASFTAGDFRAARGHYVQARVLWDFVRPVAKQFPDLYAGLGNRRTDLGPQELWTGWHRAEQVLWPAAGDAEVSEAERAQITDALLAYTASLVERVGAADFALPTHVMAERATETVGSLAVNNALGLTDAYSGTDLWGIYGGVQGSESVYSALTPVLEGADPAIASEIEYRLQATYAELAKHGSVQSGFAPYSELSDAEVTALVRTLDALAQALSRLPSEVAHPEVRSP